MTTTIPLVLGLLLVAGVLPLSTSYPLVQALGFRRVVGRTWQEARSTEKVSLLASLGGGVAMLPDLLVM
jgi:hypothetical protein